MLPKFIEFISLYIEFIEDCNWLLPKGAADSVRCMGLFPHTHTHTHTACVAQQCLHANCLLMIQKKQRSHNSPTFNCLQMSCLWSDAWSFLKASCEAKYSFWIKSCTGKELENFLPDQAVPHFRKRLREYVKSSGRHFEHLL